MKPLPVLLLILALAALLLFQNLGNIYFWTDEAETAQLARTLGRTEEGFHWRPRAWDGRNLVTEPGSAANCNEFNDDRVWILSPWGMHYLAALGFKLCGTTTFGGRFPFALLGLASVALLYWVARLYTDDTKTALLAAALLFLNTQFLLHMRQCRYYALLPFGFLLLLAGYRKPASLRHNLLVVLGGTVLFYAQNAAAFCLVGLWAHFLLFRFDRKGAVRFAAASAAVLLLALPWLLYSDPFRVARQIGSYARPAFLESLWEHARAYNNHVFPFVLLLAYPLLGKNRFLFPLTLVVAVPPVLLTSYFLWPNLQYTIYLVPLFALFSAALVTGAFRWRRPAGILILLGLVLFQGHALLPFLNEITHDYDGPNEGIVKFLRAHAEEDDLVSAPHKQLPLMFYTDLRFVYQVQTDEAEALHRVEGLPAYLFDDKKVDWIVARPKTHGMQRALAHAFAMERRGLWRLHRYTIPYPDIRWENRPHYAYHKFRTAPVGGGIVIYKVTRRERG